MKINLLINGKKEHVEVSPSDYLSETLRDIGLTSVRRGCETTSCGTCTILVDGKPVPSCSYLSVRAEGKEITTVEGIQEEVEKMSVEFGKTGAFQCGFCNSGMALATYSLKKEIENPTDEQIRDYLAGNLCRCSGYESQNEAIRNYLEVK